MAYPGRPSLPVPRYVPGLKRQAPVPVPAGGPSKSAKVAQEDSQTMVVFATSNFNEIGIRTLVGEYVFKGANHRRPFYQKTQKIPGYEDIDVFLYFWEDNSNPEQSGWWFGNSVGGSQVWSASRQKTMKPPKNGWHIPWDGEERPELCVVGKPEKLAEDKASTTARMEARRRQEDDKHVEVLATEWEDRVLKATERCAEAEIDATEALDAVQDAVDAGLEEDSPEDFQKLVAQQKSLAETQRFLALEVVQAQKAPPALKADLQDLVQRLRDLQVKIKILLQSHKPATMVKAEPADERRAQEEDRGDNELESQHANQLEEMLPAALEKVDAAEDEVEKVAIAAAPLQIECADDLRPVMLQAIKETEQRVRAAQAAIGEARRFISGKLSVVSRFAPATKRSALEEFTALQAKLTEGQNKLNPFKTVRQDFEKRMQTKKLMEELSNKLAGAEIEVEKAAMMTAPLGGDSADGIKETETALATAQSVLAQTNRLIESKLRTADKTAEAIVEEMKALQERGKLAQEKLDEVRKTVKETQVRIAADTLLKEVSDKVSAAEDELQKMAEAELPFLRSDQKGQDMQALITEADKVSVKVHQALAEAQTFVARKLVEVARFSEGPAKTVKEEVDMLQKRLEEGRERLLQFRSSTAERKKTFILEEVETKVAAAEVEVKRMSEATQSLEGGGAAGEPVSETLTEAVEQANNAERAAQASIVMARKYLVQKTADLKKLAVSGVGISGSGSDLGRLQTRVNTMQQDIVKLRANIKDAEERIRVKQLLAEVVTRLQTAEGEVEKVAAAAVPVAMEQPSVESVEAMEKATSTALNKIGAMSKLVDVKLKSAQGFLKEELQGLRSRITKAEKKLSEVTAAAKEQKERLQAAELLATALEKVERGEAVVQKASEAELPFLKGIEVLLAADTEKAIVACEAAAGAAQKTISEARTFVMQKLVDAKQFADSTSDSCTKDLLGLQKRLDSSAGKLAELKKDTAERRRKAQMQVSGEKIAVVETTVKALAETMVKFSDENLTKLSSDEARAVCEEIAGAEHAANVSVAGSKKFLALRFSEAKSLSEAQRGPAMGDLTKLQARLTQCQVELAKLSKTCTEREQRFVAQRLVQDAGESLKRLQEEAASAIKAAELLLGGGADNDGGIGGHRAELLSLWRLQAAVAALQAHQQKTGSSVDVLFAEVAGGKPASKAAFVEWAARLSELTGNDEALLTQEQAAEAWPIVAKGASSLFLDHFKAWLRERWVCTVGVPAWDAATGGKQVGNVEVGEGLEVLETGSGERARCLLARDGAEVWVAVTVDSKPSFKPSPPIAGRLESIAAAISAVHKRCAAGAEAADRKATEVASVKQGPLMEVKTKLLEVKGLLGQEQSKLDVLKKRLAITKAGIEQERKAELVTLREEKCKVFAAESVREATASVEAAEGKAAKVMDNAKPGEAERLAKELGVFELEALKKAADEALESLSDAKAVVARLLASHEAHKGPSRNLLLEARVELTKLGSRANTAERKCRTATEALRTAHLQVVKTALMRAKNSLRIAFRKLGKGADEVYDQVAGKSSEISSEQFQKFVTSLPSHDLSPEQVTLLYNEFGKYGLRKPAFCKAVQEYCTCLREIAITDGFDISSSSTVRKLDKGEFFEVLEGPVEDAAAEVRRVRGRALRDSSMGWVTIKGNQGTAFLKPREKPLLWASGDAEMRMTCQSSSSTVRRMKKDEVLELLEGPREEVFEAELYLKGTASKDGAKGWILLREPAGSNSALQSTKFYKCRSTIAMTDSFDITSCKVVRKVAIGEALEVIGGQEERADAEISITRLRFRALKDGKEGWVTLKGNQGTVFVEASTSHYVLEKATALRAAASADAAEIRSLEPGEALEAEGPPQEVTPDTKLVMKARSLEDWQAGWVSFVAGPGAPLKPWMPKYVCRAPVDITSVLSLAGGAVMRQAAPEEVFEAVEGPIVESSSGLRRIRVATAADGVIGWATLRASDDKVYLEVA